MTANLRLTTEEQNRVDDLSFNINGKRNKKRLKPLSDSKILHELIGIALDNIKIGKSGELYLDEM